MEPKKISKRSATTLNIILEPELKTKLESMALKRSMDLSKLTRAILTNWLEPDTFIL